MLDQAKKIRVQYDGSLTKLKKWLFDDYKKKTTLADINAVVHIIVQQELTKWHIKPKKEESKTNDNSFAILSSDKVMKDNSLDEE